MLAILKQKNREPQCGYQDKRIGAVIMADIKKEQERNNGKIAEIERADA